MTRMTIAGGWRATAALVALGIGVVSAQSGPALSTLTAPAASLPEGCRLTPLPPEPSPVPPVVLPDGTVVSRSSTAIRRFPSNPWFGDDYKYIAWVRPLFDPVPQMPDGPPLEKSDARRLKAKLASEIAEAYRASYQTESGRAAEVRGALEVRAVRYTDSKWAVANRPIPNRFVRGSTVIIMIGNPQSECFKAVRNHIESLK